MADRYVLKRVLGAEELGGLPFSSEEQALEKAATLFASKVRKLRKWNGSAQMRRGMLKSDAVM